jgi:iron-sulfur cluster repair protein YtfE (RIC family)
MFAHLVEVHGFFRSHLAALRRAVDDWAASGNAAPPPGVAGLASMVGRTDLRAHCLFYCRALTMHHTLEDAQMFPAMRAAYPEAAPELDRLEAEHHVVAEILDEVTVLLSTVDGNEPASEVAAALADLSTKLEEHLAYEERVLRPLFGD